MTKAKLFVQLYERSSIRSTLLLFIILHIFLIDSYLVKRFHCNSIEDFEESRLGPASYLERDTNLYGDYYDDDEEDETKPPSYDQLASLQIDALNGDKCGQGSFAENWMRTLNSYRCPMETRTSRLGGLLKSKCKTRIAGGYQPKLGDFPSFVQLVYVQGYSEALCGGVIIHNDLVLTAAHCIGAQNASGVVFAGSLSNQNEDGRGVQVNVSGECVSDRYLPGPDPTYDWAVVKLAKPLRYTESIQPACLDFYRAPSKDVACVTTGFGLTDSNLLVDSLRASVMSPCGVIGQPATSCWSQIKTNEQSGNTCQGDSGSGMYCFENCSRNVTRMYAIGVLSSGTNDNCGKHEEDYSFYADFVKQTQEAQMLELLSKCIQKLRRKPRRWK